MNDSWFERGDTSIELVKRVVQALVVDAVVSNGAPTPFFISIEVIKGGRLQSMLLVIAFVLYYVKADALRIFRESLLLVMPSPDTIDEDLTDLVDATSDGIDIVIRKSFCCIA